VPTRTRARHHRLHAEISGLLKRTFIALNQAEGEALRWGTSLEWGITICLALSGFILLCVIFAGVWFRGREAEPNALWLHLLGLGIFPLFLLPFLNFTIFEYSKQEVFCASCHATMQPWVDDLHNPKGKYLAALHYQIRFAPGQECYVCHTDYGMHGTLTAKMLGLRDAWSEITGAYPSLIKMRHPYSNRMCLKCHDNSKYFMAEDSHLDAQGNVAQEILTDSTRCTECHGPAHNIPGYPGYAPLGSQKTG
jgi:nitrate/TMAO reductase-like tetraheme cytochrome c subunit